MKFTNTIGIDVSKMTFDATIYSGQFYCQFANSNKGFKQLLNWAEKHTDNSLKTTLFCFEHTGLYSQKLSAFLSEMKISYSMVSGLALKRSAGLKRGKTDKIDSKVIAEYAFEKKHKLPLFTYPGETVLELQRLTSLRKKMVKQKAGYRTAIKEYSCILTKKDNVVFFNAQEKIVHQLTKQIDNLENQIKQLISQDKVLKRRFDLIKSIKGVGPVIAVNTA